MERKSDEEMMKFLNEISSSFCGAKWYNATIWLGSGMTTSCHHPPAHKIDINEIKTNPKAIHNTQQKKKEREMMQNGERPRGCQYCWKIEDAKDGLISDRVYKSVIYTDKDLIDASITSYKEDINLKTLEISFDRTCNFACSYCNPAFSTTWVKDIKNNGPYKHLISDGRNHFTHTHDSAQLYKPEEENPYVEAFFKWWDSDLKNTLDELRLTGGEPLMSGYTWRLLDKFIEDKPNMRFALNSNLCAKQSLIGKLIDASHAIKEFHLYTSNESMNEQSEYIRDGLQWKEWDANLHRILERGNVSGLHMMCTINALCLDSIIDFLDYLMQMKEVYGNDYPTFTLNILRFPSFQSPLVLPDDIRMGYANQLRVWLDKNIDKLHEIEKNHTKRLIDYLDIVKTPHDETFDMRSLHNDFKQFYMQYDERRGKDFCQTFPNLAEWYNKL